VKEALGLAGQNAIRLWEPEVQDHHRRWLEKAVERGRQLVVEPWLDREQDFSVQLEMGPEGLKLRGYTGLLTDRTGQFRANWAEAHHHRRLPASTAALFHQPADLAQRMLHLYQDLFGLLEEELRQAGYLGPVGVDALVYRSADGQCRLKPIVEINPRYTMGRLTVELMRHTCPGRFGMLRLVTRAMARKEGFEDFSGYARHLGERVPLQLAGAPAPRICEGALCLNDPAEAQVVLATFQVGRTLEVLRPARAGQS
jgi:hypothetical protein